MPTNARVPCHSGSLLAEVAILLRSVSPFSYFAVPAYKKRRNDHAEVGKEQSRFPLSLPLSALSFNVVTLSSRTAQ